MEVKKVLIVGQCGFDLRMISELVGEFGASSSAATSSAEVLSVLKNETVDLILANRIFSRSGQSGLELIRTLKTEPQFSAIPMMLVSDYPDAQEEAISFGALPGFGKSELSAPETKDKLRRVLHQD